jgi:DNA-binding SARP family transcriptional activator
MLGPLVVGTGDEAVPIGGMRLRSLLIRLALAAGRPVGVGTLAEALWPDEPPADPQHALQTLVTRLRRALSDGSVVRRDGQGYELVLPPRAVDTLAFEQLASQGRQALGRGDWALAEETLTRSLDLWRGEALVDVTHLPFAAAPIARLTELRLTAMEDVQAARLHLPGGDRVPVAELRQLVTSDPLRERTRLLLIKALRQEGRHAEALAAYEEFRQLAAAELGADPGPDLQTAHLEMLRRQPASATGDRRMRGNL